MKCIGKMSVKSTTTSGELCKTICLVMDNGVLHINQLVLSKKKKVNQYKVLYSKFGKTLHVKAYGFKFSTFNTIHNEAVKMISKYTPPIETIL